MFKKLNAEQDSRFRSYFGKMRGFSNRIWQPGNTSAATGARNIA
jgi:hypothetical protein